MSNITARYVNGHEEYVIKDSSFEGEIKLTYTRSDKIDAMLVKAELPDSVKDKLVVAAAGGTVNSLRVEIQAHLNLVRLIQIQLFRPLLIIHSVSQAHMLQ